MLKCRLAYKVTYFLKRIYCNVAGVHYHTLFQGETKENIDSLNGAVAALEKGMGAKSFIQTPTASLLSKVLQRMDSVDASDRDTLMAFLQGE